MSVLPVGFGAQGAGYQIEKSLRFRRAASARQQRTFGTPTSTTVWTFSTWVKRGALAGNYRIIGAGTDTFLTFDGSDRINLVLSAGSAFTTTAVFRDPFAHYHIVYQQNGSAQTLWVNNVSYATGTRAASVFNTAVAHQIGAANSLDFYDGNQSEIIWVDGQALTPSAFGQTDPITGVWVPKQYTGTYGANGFYLPFDNGTTLTTLGEDRSGNNNDWTLTNFSLTAGVTYDWSDDTPSNNFASLSSLITRTTAVISNANTTATANAINREVFVDNFPLPANSKIYIEATLNALGGPSTATLVGVGAFRQQYRNDGSIWRDGTSVGTFAALGVGGRVGMAIDTTANTIAWYRNGVLQTTTTPTDTLAGNFIYSYFTATNDQWVYNFGATPYIYTPPTGFGPLSTGSVGPITPISSGSFAGNANVNGSFVWLAGTPSTMTINGNAVTFGTHADRLANGIKLRSSSASYNAAGANTFSVASFVDDFTDPNRAKVNP